METAMLIALVLMASTLAILVAVRLVKRRKIIELKWEMI